MQKKFQKGLLDFILSKMNTLIFVFLLFTLMTFFLTSTISDAKKVQARLFMKNLDSSIKQMLSCEECSCNIITKTMPKKFQIFNNASLSFGYALKLEKISSQDPNSNLQYVNLSIYDRDNSNPITASTIALPNDYKVEFNRPDCLTNSTSNPTSQSCAQEHYAPDSFMLIRFYSPDDAKIDFLRVMKQFKSGETKISFQALSSSILAQDQAGGVITCQ
jgi:hypothetical protein